MPLKRGCDCLRYSLNVGESMGAMIPSKVIK